MLAGVLSGSRLRYFARSLPVLLAAYELRYLFASAGHDASAIGGLVSRSDLGGLALFLMLALVAAVLLREMGRGLYAQVPRPRWSAGFVGVWLLGSAVLMVCFAGEELWHGSVASGTHASFLQIVGIGGWSSLPSVLFVGFLAAVSLRCARWAFRAAAGWLRTRLARDLSPPLRIVRLTSPALPRLAPVADGWSSRGPPLHVAVAVSVS